MPRRLAVLDAPSNLGLRPPSSGAVPGCLKAPGALRDHQLVARLAADDAGCVTPPRYDPGDWRPGDGVCQAEDIAAYSRRLATRIGGLLDSDQVPLVLGGDCSILLGSALALRRRGADQGLRYGLVFIDGHSDFRHPGNAEYVGAAAGEDLALATGRGDAVLTDIDRLRPYLRSQDVVVLGIRDHDEYRLDLQAAGIAYRTVPVLRGEGMPRSAAWARDALADLAGYWIHVDVDVLDPGAMPAVDAPDPGGIGYGELEHLLADLVATPACLGLEVTVFDPDYDPDGTYAGEVVDALVSGLRPIWSAVVGEPAGTAGQSTTAAVLAAEDAAASAGAEVVSLSSLRGETSGDAPGSGEASGAELPAEQPAGELAGEEAPGGELPADKLSAEELSDEQAVGHELSDEEPADEDPADEDPADGGPADEPVRPAVEPIVEDEEAAPPPWAGMSLDFELVRVHGAAMALRDQPGAADVRPADPGSAPGGRWAADVTPGGGAEVAGWWADDGSPDAGDPEPGATDDPTGADYDRAGPDPAHADQAGPDRAPSEQDRAEQDRAEQDGAEQDGADQDRAGQPVGQDGPEGAESSGQPEPDDADSVASPAGKVSPLRPTPRGNRKQRRRKPGRR